VAQGVVDFCRVFTACLGEVRTAAPAASENGRDLFDDVAGVEPLRKILGY